MPFVSRRLMYTENSRMEPVGSVSRIGINSPSRRMYTRRLFLQALPPFAPLPNWFSGHLSQRPPGSPVPITPS